MNRYSILLLKKSQSGVLQLHFSPTLVFILMMLVIGGSAWLGLIFYRQHLMFQAQEQVIIEQETVQAELMRRVDRFGGREARIEFLEDYVDELKQNAYNSEITLRKHIALVESSVSRISQLHDSLCGILETDCSAIGYDPKLSRQVVPWLDQLQIDFEKMDTAFKEFALNRQSYENQVNTIEELQTQVKQMEQNLAEHIEFIQVNQNTFDRLNRKISKATGISLDRKSFKSPASKSSKGRGGPSALDTLTLENPLALQQPGILRRFLYSESLELDVAVASLEELSSSIEKNYTNWRQTPTLIPTRSRLLSDRFGNRRDPFTRTKEFHGGLDFIARRGSPVYAPADAIVRLAKRHYGFGKMVELQHGRGFYPGQRKTVRYRTRFAHLSKILVKRRQRISRGDIIGMVGSTGRSTGPHLHYEVLINNRQTDPLLTISRFNSGKRLYVR